MSLGVPKVAKESSLGEFFQVEIRNEAQGGISPATLFSAADSLNQAPFDVLTAWFDTDDLETITRDLIFFSWLLVNYKIYTELRDLLT